MNSKTIQSSEYIETIFLVTLQLILSYFSAMSIAESSKEPGYGEDSASPLMSSNSYALSHSSSFGGGRGSIGSATGSGGSHRNSSNSSSLFSQQRTQL